MRMRHLKTVHGPIIAIAVVTLVIPSVNAYVIENAEYIEKIWGQADDGWYTGEDDSKPEKVEHTYIYIDPVYGTEIRYDSRAETFSKGPGAEVSIDGISTPPPNIGWAETRANAWSNTYYEAVIYNPFGTDEEYSPPVSINIVGYGEANASGTGHAEVYGSVTVWSPGGEPFCQKQLQACSGTSLLKTCSSDIQPIDLFEKSCVSHYPVGTEQGASYKMTIRLHIETAVDVGASRESEYPPRSGAALGFGFVDPIISIDPEWEHADKFEIILSPGVEQGIREIPTKPSAPPMPWLHLLLD